MFQVKDNNGKTLHIDDEVSLVSDETKKGVLIAILSETECQIVLEGVEGTQIVPPGALVQKKSLFESLISLTSIEELQKIFEAAKSLVPLARKGKSRAKTNSGGRPKGAAAVTVEEEA